MSDIPVTFYIFYALAELLKAGALGGLAVFALVAVGHTRSLVSLALVIAAFATIDRLPGFIAASQVGAPVLTWKLLEVAVITIIGTLAAIGLRRLVSRSSRPAI